MNLFKKVTTAATAGALSLGLAMSAAAPASAAGVLTAPEADWTGGQVTCKIIQFLSLIHI